MVKWIRKLFLLFQVMCVYHLDLLSIHWNIPIVKNTVDLTLCVAAMAAIQLSQRSRLAGKALCVMGHCSQSEPVDGGCCASAFGAFRVPPPVSSLSLSQSMLAVFMRPGSLLFEIFPHKYFKAGYQPMTTGLAIRHGFARSRPHMPLSGFKWPSEATCMKHFWCRWYARRSNVDLSEEGFDTLVSLALETQPCGST